jgi:hypothetical protein
MLPGLTNRQWSLFLAASFLVMFSAAARAQLMGIQYITTTSNGQITITGFFAVGSGPLTIPSTINGLPVVSIGELAFEGCTNVTSVTIPNSVTSIGDSAFEGCTNVTSVTIPNSVTSIGGEAFEGCTSLTSVTIPNSVTSIGDGTFSSCSSLTSITVSAQNSAYSSLNGVLFNNNQTTLIQYPAGVGGTYTIPNSVTSIEGGAFFGCSSLTSVTIPGSVTSIGDGTFAACGRLTSITVSAQNSAYSSVGGVLFNNNQTTIIQYPGGAGSSYTIPNSVTSIEGYAFNGCTSLTSVTIPNSVTSIGKAAFTNCTRLTSTTIPNSVTSIGEAAFEFCTNLTSVTIGNSVTSIGDYAFLYCPGLTSVTIPNSVTSIGEAAFSACFNLTSVTIGNSLTSIGVLAFDDCTALTSVTIPNSVTSIQSDAFYGCTDLTSANFLGNAPTMGSSVFYDAAHSFTVSYYYGATGFTSPTWTDSSGDSYPAVEIIPFTTSPDGNGGLIITGYTGPNEEAVIPQEINNLLVTGIGPDAFEGDVGLTGVVVPSGVTSIASNAFISCTSLTQITVSPQNSTYSSINGVLFDKSQDTLIQCPEGITGSYTIPNSVTTVGDEAFFNCAGLTAVTIPNTVTSIGEGAFSDCTLLTSVTIPSSITTIADGTFDSCGLKNVTIPTSVTSIGNQAFESSGLGSVTIPDSVTSIGVGAFQYCGLSSAIIGNGVTSIGVNAFEFCNTLNYVSIGDSVTSIGSGAFESCNNLTTVTIPASVTSIGSQAFLGSSDIGSFGFIQTELRNAVFLGNAPAMGQYVFGYTTGLFAPPNVYNFTAYYYPGATGFTSPTWVDSSGDSYPAIALMTFSQWETSYNISSGPTATPENDGVPNLLKYLYDINPTVPMTETDRAALPTLGMTTTFGIANLTLTYRQYASQTGINVQVQTSPDLQTWTTVTLTSTPIAYIVQKIGTDSNTGDPIMQVTVPYTGSKEFIRLNVTQP